MIENLENRDERRLRLAIVTDQFLPGDTSDTSQLVSTAAGFGYHGVDTTLVFPVREGHTPTAPKLATHYGVAPSFEVLPLSGPYPAPLGFRGLEKVAHAQRAARRIATLRLFDATLTRNLPAVLALLAWTRRPVFYETYRPWADLDQNKARLLSALSKQQRLAGIVLSDQRLVPSFRGVGFGEERLCVAPHGLEARDLGPDLDRDEARMALGLAAREPLVVYAGPIQAGLGLELVVKAALKVPEATLALLGSLGHGPIEELARQAANVRVLPWAPPREVTSWLAAADVLLIPPSSAPAEALTAGSSALTRLLSAGRAILGPAALAGTLTDRYDALLVGHDDLDGLVTALRTLVGDPGLRAALGNRARHGARGRSWEERAGRILDFMATRGVEPARHHRASTTGPRRV